MSVAVLISGRGSNLRALVAAGLPIACVISHREDAAGLAFARTAGIPSVTVAHERFATRAAFDAALDHEISRYAPQVVALAGFMRVLTPEFTARYAGRLLNVHPALLPAFPGLHTHARALAAGVKIHGCTVHFVTADVDHGPTIIQAAVPVKPDDDAERLAARVLAQEHRIYPQAVRWFLEGKLGVADGIVRVRDPLARQWLWAGE